MSDRKLYHQEYYRKNRAKLRAGMKAWNEAHVEHIKAYSRRYDKERREGDNVVLERHPDSSKAKAILARRERYRASAKRYQRTEKGRAAIKRYTSSDKAKAARKVRRLKDKELLQLLAKGAFTVK